MELDFSTLLKLISLTTLGTVLLYVLIELYRKQQSIRSERKVYAMRLQALDEKVRFERVRATQAEQKALNTWSGTRKFHIDEIVDEADSVRSYYLAPHDGKPLPAFDPGQYLTFSLDVPGQRRPVTRCYSLSDTPLIRDRYRVTIKRIAAPRDKPDVPAGLSSSFFHTQLRTGDILDCKSPSGNFCLDMAEHTPIVLIGGGIGITPMLCMLRSVAFSDSKRETWLFYGVCDSTELVQARELRSLADEHENIHVRFCFSAPLEKEQQGRDYDFAEWVSVDLLRRELPSINFDYYVCGPPPMMSSITTGLAEVGVHADRVHHESFGPASIKAKSSSDKSTPDNRVFSVNFAKSNMQLEWNSQSGSLLELAEANGLALECGCRAGSCGSCAVAIRKGSIEYLDEVSAQPESGSCLACLAIPKEALIIDA